MLLITLVSEQVIPSIVLIKELKKDIRRYLFITTPEMEEAKKTDTIIKINNLDKKQTTKIVASANNLQDIYEKVTSFLKKWPNDKQIYINLTGGTKLMSITVYNASMNFNPTYIYIPLSVPFFFRLKDKFSLEKIPIKETLTIYEYLDSSGFYINDENWVDPLFSPVNSNKIFENFKRNNFDLKYFPFDLAKKLCKNESVEDDNIPGLWFEDFIYHKIILDLEITENYIARNVKFYFEKESNNEYEVDIAFTRNNELYLVECKVSLNKHSKTNIISRDLEKLSIISRKFGYNTKAFFLTLADLRIKNDNGIKFPIFTPSLRNKLQILNIQNIADKWNFSVNKFNLKSVFLNI